MYQIQIIKFVPRTQDEKDKILEAKKYGRDFPLNDYPNFANREDYKTYRVLDVELSDEEFQEVKKSVWAVM